ncbi:MAG: conjugal transfer protein TraC [Phenylobacterium sp.]|uniref:conjugal transfer protein TraD n=1 Tax=Phenylobacterium sp. TaxID=1871053 RepID=UPI00121C02C8|nr:conjugal transfer protein TraD [Phenylobacterium sp.]TAJ70419.1 MAG: conjugal transfer protein TraC [Phenylobacterium sp.]
MRKPRDIDAELRALSDKAKGLKARKITQLGELVAATGADSLDADILAGVLIAAVEAKGGEVTEGWRRRGEAFFQRQGRTSGSAAGGRRSPASRSSGDAAG